MQAEENLKTNEEIGKEMLTFSKELKKSHL